jgi:hypothetical protein
MTEDDDDDLYTSSPSKWILKERGDLIKKDTDDWIDKGGSRLGDQDLELWEERFNKALWLHYFLSIVEKAIDLLGKGSRHCNFSVKSMHTPLGMADLPLKHSLGSTTHTLALSPNTLVGNRCSRVSLESGLYKLADSPHVVADPSPSHSKVELRGLANSGAWQTLRRAWRTLHWSSDITYALSFSYDLLGDSTLDDRSCASCMYQMFARWLR